MSGTYNPTLPTDRDWVRFQLGDRGPTTWVLDDAEINAALVEESNKFLAAYRLGNDFLARRGGITSKSVDGLSVSYGDGAEGSFRSHLKDLQKRGLQLLQQRTGSSTFRVIRGVGE